RVESPQHLLASAQEDHLSSHRLLVSRLPVNPEDCPRLVRLAGPCSEHGLRTRRSEAPTSDRPGDGAGARGPLAARRPAGWQTEGARRLEPGTKPAIPAHPPPHRPGQALPPRTAAADGLLGRSRAV